jgi:hypothetical protein
MLTLVGTLPFLLLAAFQPDPIPRSFHTELLELFPDADLPALPPKTFLRDTSPAFIETRRMALQTYLCDLLTRFPSVIASPPFKSLLTLR